ncbi:hypothetical protein [Prescottella agglutinans]|uniref:Uncharacterized protein n=1 Tax=Prescottella agglutinans TaxID=1644129 RepID=A0ABT6MGG4_9NOCA|nr:hypothetical protein [Prescottella agglutinans]MDH6282891.1 hypothetical protein [Prescottella agglutinans]
MTGRQWAVDCGGQYGEEDLCIHLTQESAEACLATVYRVFDDVEEWDYPPRVVTRADESGEWTAIEPTGAAA